jgi:hypothetical protein
MWRAAANKLNKQSRAADNGRSSSLSVGEALTTLHLKNYISHGLRLELILWLRVFEIRVLRRVFEPKTEELTGEWKRLNKEERNELYTSPNTIRVVRSKTARWVGHVARISERRGAYRIFVGTPERSRPFGRPKRR